MHIIFLEQVLEATVLKTTIWLRFLHGFLGDARDWQDVLASDALRRWSCDAMDLPIADDWGSGIAQVSAGLRDDVVLVGYSMGARVALAVAMANVSVKTDRAQNASGHHASADSLRLSAGGTPARIAGLVLISGSPGLETQERARRRAHDQALAARLEKLAESTDRSEGTRAFLEQWYAQPVFSDLSSRQISQLIATRQTMDLRRQSRLLRTWSVSEQTNYWDRIAELDVPTLFITGQHDAKYQQIGRRFVQQCPRAELRVIENAGHDVQRHNRSALITCLVAFLRRLEDAAE